MNFISMCSVFAFCKARQARGNSRNIKTNYYVTFWYFGNFVNQNEK